MRPMNPAEAKKAGAGSRQKALLDNVEKIYYAFDKSGDGKVDEGEFIAGLCLSDEMWSLFAEVNPFWQHQLKSVYNKEADKKKTTAKPTAGSSRPGSKQSSRRGSKASGGPSTPLLKPAAAENFLAGLPAPPPGSSRGSR